MDQSPNVVHGRSPYPLNAHPRALSPWRIVTPWEGGRPLHRLLYGDVASTAHLSTPVRAFPIVLCVGVQHVLLVPRYPGGDQRHPQGVIVARPHKHLEHGDLPAQSSDREARRTRREAPSGDQKGFVQGGTGSVACDPERRLILIEIMSDSGLASRVRRAGNAPAFDYCALSITLGDGAADPAPPLRRGPPPQGATKRTLHDGSGGLCQGGITKILLTTRSFMI